MKTSHYLYCLRSKGSREVVAAIVSLKGLTVLCGNIIKLWCIKKISAEPSVGLSQLINQVNSFGWTSTSFIKSQHQKKILIKSWKENIQRGLPCILLWAIIILRIKLQLFQTFKNLKMDVMYPYWSKNLSTATSAHYKKEK